VRGKVEIKGPNTGSLEITRDGKEKEIRDR